MTAASQLKQSLTRAVQDTMRRKRLNVSAVAGMVGCDRKVVQRILDPNYMGITLRTIDKVTRGLSLAAELKIRRLSLRQLSPIAKRIELSSSPEEAKRLTKQFMEGYYGKRIRLPNAKASAV
jgi:hypothetical protein